MVPCLKLSRTANKFEDSNPVAELSLNPSQPPVQVPSGMHTTSAGSMGAAQGTSELVAVAALTAKSLARTPWNGKSIITVAQPLPVLAKVLAMMKPFSFSCPRPCWKITVGKPPAGGAPPGWITQKGMSMTSGWPMDSEVKVPAV